MKTHMNTLQRKIMRGIYYAYIIRIVTMPGVWQSFFMLVAFAGLTRFVSISNVLHNFSVSGVSNADTFFYNAVRTTEVWTFFLLGVLVFLSLSIRFSIIPKGDTQYSFARV